MAEPRIFTPKTQQSLERTLEATHKAMAEVRENMRILEESKERADLRIDGLTEELAKAKQALADLIASEKALRKRFDQQGAEQKRAAADFAAAQGQLEGLHKQLQDASAERAALATQAQESLAAERAATGKLNAQLEDITHSIEEQQAQHDRLLAERDKGFQAVKREMADAQAKVKRLSSDAETLAKRSAASDEQCVTLQSHLNEAAKVREVLETTAADTAARTQELTRQNATLEERVAALGNENQALTAKLQEALDEIQGVNAQLVSERELRETLEVNLDVSRRVVEELKHALPVAQGSSS